jgi:SAM-dependent methyltransferase
MAKDNFRFWREVWKKYPETEIVYSTEKGKLRTQFYAELLPKKKGLVLDLGCGDGHLRPYIQSYVGVDVSVEALAKIEGDVVLGIGEALPFRDNVFDYVLMCEVFEHIVDRAKCLRGVNRILKPEGELIMSCPYGYHPSHKSDSSSLSSYGLPKMEYQNGRFDDAYLIGLLLHFGFLIGFIRIISVKDVPNNIFIIGVKEK